MKNALIAAAVLSLALSACVTTERTEKETVIRPAPTSSSTVVVPSDRPSDTTTVIVPR